MDQVKVKLVFVYFGKLLYRGASFSLMSRIKLIYKCKKKKFVLNKFNYLCAFIFDNKKTKYIQQNLYNTFSML